jgi:uncharacterized protein (UPF0262 family)
MSISYIDTLNLSGTNIALRGVSVKKKMVVDDDYFIRCDSYAAALRIGTKYAFLSEFQGFFYSENGP